MRHQKDDLEKIKQIVSNIIINNTNSQTSQMNINIQVDKSLFGGGNQGATNVNSNLNQSNGTSGGVTPMININGAPTNINNGNIDIMSRMNSGALPPNSSLMQQRAKKQGIGKTLGNQGNGFGISQSGAGNAQQQQRQTSNQYNINQLPPRPLNSVMQQPYNAAQNSNMLSVKPNPQLRMSSNGLPNLTSHRSVTMNQYDQQQQYMHSPGSPNGQQHMTLNIPLDDMMLGNQDIDNNSDEFMKEIAAAESSENSKQNRRQSLTNAKNKSNLISYKINAIQGGPVEMHQNGGLITDTRVNRKQLMNGGGQDSNSSVNVVNPNGGIQTEQYQVNDNRNLSILKLTFGDNKLNVTITQVGNNIQSKIDINNQIINDEFEEQKMLDEQEMQQILQQHSNKFDFNNNGTFSHTSSSNSRHIKKQIQQQQQTSPVLPIKNGLMNPQPQDGDTPHSLRKSTTNENIVPVVPELDEKMKKYDPKSLNFFNIHWNVRQQLIKLMTWKYYEYFMILTIFGNSLCLALNDYQDDENITVWNQTLQKIDKAFTVIYTVECIMKILAFGLVMHKRSYLRDGWNVLDFIIVITGLITLIPDVPNLKSLRIMRVFRPLRSIHAVPSMKRQVKTLIMSLPQMGYVASLLLFFLCVAAILGLQLFTRDLYFRCRLTDEPILASDNKTWSWPIDPDQRRNCGGLYTCNQGTYCHALHEKGIPLSVDKIGEQDFIFWGILTFDNIGEAILSIFRVITLESWTYVMYNYMDSSGIIAAIYFPILVVLGGFFLLNLFLAVIMESFEEMSSRPVLDAEQELMMESMETEQGDTTTESQQIAQQLKKQSEEEITHMINVTKKRMEMLHKGPMSIQDAAVLMIEQKRKLAKAQPPVISSIDQNNPDSNPVIQSKEFQSPGNLPLNDLQYNTTEGKLPNETDLLQDGGETPRQGNEFLSAENIIVIQNSKSTFQKCRDGVLSFCESSFFASIINLSIILNTLCLGLDSYPENLELNKVTDTFNIVFFGIFFVEMLIKNLGMGPRLYIKDPFNVFDAIIVMVSIFDVILSYAVPGDQSDSGKGPISAFRAFRLLRVFKLSKSWKKLHYLLSTIARALREISSFSVLLFLLIFIYVLLGMELFADRTANANVNSLSLDDYVETPRANFNNFFNGFILIFTVLTGESWDMNMIIFARTYGYSAIFFFVSFVIIGVMIFLNLFLAILLDNFEEEEQEEEAGELANLSFSQKAQHYTFQFYSSLRASFNGLLGNSDKNKIMSEATEENPLHTITNTIDGKNSPFGRKGISKQISIDTFQNEQEIEDNIVDVQNLNQALNVGFESEGTIVKRQAGSEMNLFQGHRQEDIVGQKSNHRGIINKNPLPVIQSQENLTISEDALKIEDKEFPNYDFNSSEDIEGLSKNLSQKQVDKNIKGELSGNMEIKDELQIDQEISHFEQQEEEEQRRRNFMRQNTHKFRKGASIKPSNSNNSDSAHLKRQYTLNNQQLSVHNNEEFDRESEGEESKKLSRQGTKSIALIMKEKVYQQNIAQQNNSQYANYCEGNSLLFFGPHNSFRVGVMNLIRSQTFEGFILLLITFQSILLALDNPLNDPDSFLVTFLSYCDIVFSAIFLVEALLKIIAYGLFFNRDVAYLKNGWNVIDIFVVIISLTSIFLSGKLKIIKIFRLFRVLRPLRVISRNKGLRIGIQALFMAVPSIISVLIVSLLFYIIFGIFGVNYFKGTLFSCQYFDQYPDFLQPPPLMALRVTDKWSCMDWGGAWVNYDYTFDNLPQAVSTLFQMSTTEGWVEVMNRAVDSVDIDKQPVLNQNVIWSIFFMVFVFFGNFLILDLFTGVVVQTFNREKEILGKNFLLSDNQKKWIEQKKICMKIKPKILIAKVYNPVRLWARNIVMSKQFEVFILVLIFLNSCVLSINWYDQPKMVDDVLGYINYGFAIIFALEALLKLIAFGCRTYFRDGGNIFDMIIVIISIVSSVISLSFEFDFGASATFIRALRISRVLKFVQKAKQMRVILDTFTFVLPALTNIGGLLMLFLYIFSILGVFLFAEVKLQWYLDVHANFQSFGSAFLTLLRCATGEAWNSIMVDTMRQNQILFQCSNEDFDFAEYAKNGFQTNGCGSTIAGLIFFMTFQLFVPLIFLDLFIAIILEGFEQMNQNINIVIPEYEFEKFRDCWSEFDKDGTGFIAVADFPQFMLALSDPLGWNPKLYEQNQKLQDDFLEELNVKTYDSFRYYLFWEVLQGLTKMYIIKMDLLRRIEKAEEIMMKKNFIENDGNDEDIHIDFNNPGTLHDQKLQLRIELEFETLDEERKDAMDVEEVKMKEQSIIKGYLHRQDESYTSAHIKAGRKILAALKRIRNKRLGIQNTILGGGKTTLSSVGQNVGFGNTSDFSEEFKVPHASGSPQPGIAVNSQVVFRNTNINKQQSINTSDELTILDGEVDFADGGTGAKKIVRREVLHTPYNNNRPITQSMIGQGGNSATPGVGPNAGTTGSPLDQLMMNDFILDQQSDNMSPEILNRQRNNRRDRALAQLRQQNESGQEPSIFVDMQQQLSNQNEESKNVRNDWNDVPANMQSQKKKKQNHLMVSNMNSLSPPQISTSQARKSARRPPVIILNSSNGFDNFKDHTPPKQPNDQPGNIFGGQGYNLDFLGGEDGGGLSSHEMLSRQIKIDSQNMHNDFSLGEIKEHSSIEHSSFIDQLK